MKLFYPRPQAFRFCSNSIAYRAGQGKSDRGESGDIKRREQEGARECMQYYTRGLKETQ